jgi:hypothetical protein
MTSCQTAYFDGFGCLYLVRYRVPFYSHHMVERSSSLYTTEGKEGLDMFGTQIPLPPMDEKKKVIEDVDKDRRYAIDASIVRIMKSRKVLPHQQLVLECIEQLGRMFKASFFLFLCWLHVTSYNCYY